jgi:DNA-binding MarR family transcriptional regulator
VVPVHVAVPAGAVDPGTADAGTAVPGAVNAAPVDLPERLEKAFRLLGTRIFASSMRELRMVHPGLDRAGITLLGVVDATADARPSDVAATVGLDLSTVSRQIRQLEQLGLLSRRPDGADRRASRLSLTARGRDSLAMVRARRAEMLGEVFGDWPDAERHEFLRLLSRLLDGLSALPVLPCPPMSKESQP